MANRLAQETSGIDKVPLSWPVVKRAIEVPAIRTKVSILSSNIPKWANKIAEYLQTERLPETREETRKIRRKAVRF